MSSNKEGKTGKTLGEELAAAAETGSGDGGGEKRKKGRGGSKKKLLLIPILGVLVVLAGGFVWKRFSGGGPVKADRELLLRKANSLEEASGKDGEGAALLKALNPHAKEAAEAEADSMTMSESIEYIEALAPQTLGLEGSSMDEYEVFPTVGTVLVDGVPCTEVYVYRQDAKTGTNTFQGSYLLDRSGNALYALDREQGVVTQLQPMRGG